MFNMNQQLSFDEIKKLSKFTWIISLLYSIFYVFGKYAINEKYIDFLEIKIYILIFLFFIPINLICVLIYNFLDNYNSKRENLSTNLNWLTKNRFFIFCFIIILWIPQWLSLFPGCFNYDGVEIWEQYVNNEFIAQYPPLYSLILIGFLRLSFILTEKCILGIALYTVLQMIIFSAVFTYSIYILDKYGISNRLKIFSILYYGLFPPVYFYVLSFTKDSLFNSFFYLSFLLYLEFIKEKNLNKKKLSILIISNLISILLRRNVIYVYLIFFIILIVIKLFKKSINYKFIYTLIFPILLFFIINNFLNQLLNVKTESDISGMLSVPVQQIAYVYNKNNESLTQLQKSKILEVVEDKVIRNYYPEVSDSILYYTKTDKIIENKEAYWKIWLNIGKINISNYLNAILLLDYGYFYPDAVQKIYLRNDCYENRAFLENWFLIGSNQYNVKMFSSLNILNLFFANGILQKVPIIKYLFSIGAFVWIFIFAIFYSIYKKRKSFIYSSILIILLLLTYLLGPLVMVRYYLILFLIFPICLSILLENNKFS